MRRALAIAGGLLALAGLALAGALAFGTARPPPELTSISAPFAKVDFSAMPPLEKLEVAHGSPLAFRRYGEARFGAVIALHGSSGLGASLHPLAEALAARGHAVYLPDLRGHGATGRRGTVDFLGQPDLDLDALVTHVAARDPGRPIALAGFSLGGGFALRWLAGRPNAPVSHLVLLAPALGADSGAQTARGDAWAAPHIPRIVALTILKRLGITAFNQLEAIAYAVPKGSDEHQAGRYSYALLFSLLPSRHRDLFAAIRQPITVLVGARDEIFSADTIARTIAAARPDARTVIVPDVSHVGLTLEPGALAAIGEALEVRRP